MYDDVATELKEQRDELKQIRKAQAVVLGTLRQLVGQFQPPAKRQRVVPVHTERKWLDRRRYLDQTVRRGRALGVKMRAVMTNKM